MVNGSKEVLKNYQAVGYSQSDWLEIYHPPFKREREVEMNDFSRRFRNHLHSHYSDMVFVAFCLLVPYHLHAT